MSEPIPSADQAFADFVSKAQADPSVLGLVLHGSRVFDGMATGKSDYDLGLIPDETEAGRRWQPQKTNGLDVYTTSLADFHCAVLQTDDMSRYIGAHSRVLIDRLDGRLAEILKEAGTFPARSQEKLPDMLDTYINLLYRSLKNWRDGREIEAHFDAAESMNVALWVVFAMHQRVRPPNKYLRWELQRRPLGTAPWDAGTLITRVQSILADGEPESQRSLFRDIESMARAEGLGDTVDAWGSDLHLLHNAHPGS